MNFVEISYGGSEELQAVKDKANIGIVYDCKLTIKNSNISNSVGYGVSVAGDGELTAFEKNVFVSNAIAPIKLEADQVSKLDQASLFTGNNGKDVVEIEGSDLKESQEVIWTNFTDGTKYL